MQNIDITGTNEYINALCDWIDEQWALAKQWHGYVNGPEVDIEEYHLMPSCRDGFDWNNAEWDNLEVAYYEEILQKYPGCGDV